MIYILKNEKLKKVIITKLSLRAIGEILGIVKSDGQRRSLSDTYKRKNFYKGWRIDSKLDVLYFNTYLEIIKKYPYEYEVIKECDYSAEELIKKLGITKEKEEPKPYNEFEDSKDMKERKRNVLCIGDLHIPFEHKGALAFCKEVMANNDITDVIFMGDLIDLHYSSYHDQNPDGMSAGYELEKAIATVDNWVKVFPEATLLLGNHDRIASRKAFSSGLSKRWIRTIDEVLNLRKWDVVTSKTIGNFFFNHGEQGVARTKCRNLAMSVVQGHLHSDFFCDIVSTNRHGDNFAIQTGCLVDHESYAMAYAKNGKPMKKGLVIIEDIEGNPTVKMITMPQKFKDMAKL